MGKREFDPNVRKLTLQESLFEIDRNIRRGQDSQCAKIPSPGELIGASEQVQRKAAELRRLCSSRGIKPWMIVRWRSLIVSVVVVVVVASLLG